MIKKDAWILAVPITLALVAFFGEKYASHEYDPGVQECITSIPVYPYDIALDACVVVTHERRSQLKIRAELEAKAAMDKQQ